MAKPASGKNFLLSSLSPNEYLGIAPLLQPVDMKLRMPLHEPGKPISHVYFPTTAVASLVTTMEDGDTVEAATVSNEGMVGLPMFLETGTVSSEAFVQVSGEGLRMKASAFRTEIRDGGALYAVVQRYSQVLLRLIAQSAACNRLHSLRQRCARWLLMAHDRVRGDAFFLTQEFLSQMLGVRRATVTNAATDLRNLGLIRYRQGHLEVLDRPGLESVACECYGVIRREFDRLSNGTKPPQG
jgi:CRP-like cAMP-binding protein